MTKITFKFSKKVDLDEVVNNPKRTMRTLVDEFTTQIYETMSYTQTQHSNGQIKDEATFRIRAAKQIAQQLADESRTFEEFEDKMLHNKKIAALINKRYINVIIQSFAHLLD